MVVLSQLLKFHLTDAHGRRARLVDVAASLANSRKSAHKPSILQDLELGRPMEIDALYVTPLNLAHRLGVPMPVFELLVGLTKVRARSAGLYPN